jgi:ectoine hydroxylase-related dioxygenase (phytanoyl-CoA dioxygenase family)
MNDQLARYRRDGYTVFRSAYNEETMQTWRDEQDRLEAASTGPFAQKRSFWFGNMLERAPQLMWQAVANPLVLDFAEQVVGPFVQLDNLTLAAFPSKDIDDPTARQCSWHRDRWAHMPSGQYDRPLSMNAICYLQDLTDENGPLRVITGSHITPVTMGEEERAAPHPDEELLYLQAGDLVLTHNGLLHSGTPNTSGKKRYFFSVYYNISWLKYTDTFDGPNCRQLIAWARKRNDHRALRLLGQDDHLQARGNSGFQAPDESRWAEWSKADRDAIVESGE